jgi:hypothetical protein
VGKPSLPSSLRRQGKGRGSPARVAERRVDALKLAQDGFTYRQIAAQLGVSTTQAFKDVHASLDELKEVELGEAEKYRTLELSRIDRLYSAVSKQASRGNLGAVAAALRLSEHRCDLLGLTGKRTIAGAGGPSADQPPQPTVNVTVINQQTIIQIREVANVAREHGLLDRLLGLPEVQTVASPVTGLEGEHAGNGNGHALGGNGNGHHGS